MNITKKYVIILMTVLMISLFSLSTFAYPSPDNPLDMDIGHILAPETIQHQALLRYAEMVEERTDGALKINVFPAQQLGSAPDMLESVSIGAQSMWFETPSWLQVYSERLKVTEIPFLYDGTMEHLDRYYDEVLEDKILPELIENGNVRMINYGNRWLRTPYMVLVSRKPVFSVEDIQDLNIRIWPSATIQETWGRMGPDVTIIDYSEVYLALQYGTVDALPTPITLVYPQRFTEVAKYVIETRDYAIIDALVINNDLWEGLSPSQQQAMLEASDEIGDWLNEHVMEQVEEMKQRMISEHNAVFIRINRKPLEELVLDNALPVLIEEGIIKQEHADDLMKIRD